jgi:hypothetical protein
LVFVVFLVDTNPTVLNLVSIQFSRNFLQIAIIFNF